MAPKWRKNTTALAKCERQGLKVDFLGVTQEFYSGGSHGGATACATFVQKGCSLMQSDADLAARSHAFRSRSCPSTGSSVSAWAVYLRASQTEPWTIDDDLDAGIRRVSFGARDTVNISQLKDVHSLFLSLYCHGL